MAIAKSGLDAAQVTLLRETGVVVITTVPEGTDVSYVDESTEALADKIVELVRL